MEITKEFQPKQAELVREALPPKIDQISSTIVDENQQTTDQISSTIVDENQQTSSTIVDENQQTTDQTSSTIIDENQQTIDQISSTIIDENQQTTNRLCLTMIVKNESKIINRCINSVINYIDAICICDTGSTDNTIELIEKYKDKLPTKVIKHEWKNFGHNRSLSFVEAVKFCKEIGWNLNKSYSLFIDADMKIEIKPKYNINDLTAVGYRIIQYNSSIRYHNLRFARMDINWICKCPTHEYWSPEGDYDIPSLETIEINDIGDGGAKADKYERDIKLLTEGLKEEPLNERYMFYLAQSYSCINKNEEAIDWYKKRVERGGWNEEVFYAAYMIGEEYNKMKQYENASFWYLKAYNIRPCRNESIYKLSKMYRILGQNQLGYMFSKKSLEIPYPKNDVLFVSYPSYEYLPLIELSICAFYTPYKLEGFIATEILLRKKYNNPMIYGNAFQNLYHYIQKIKCIKNIEIPNQLTNINYNVMNPSIIKWNKGYIVNARHVNWYVDKDGSYKTIDGGKLIIPRNYLYFYDKHLNLTKNIELKDNLDEYDKEKLIIGLEDVRLFKFNNKLYGMPNTKLYSKAPQIALIEIEPDKGIIKSKTHLDYDKNPDVCQKNWMPISGNGSSFKVIQNHEPFVIMDCDTNGIINKTHQEFNYRLNQLRGGGIVKYKDGYLAITHEVYFINKKRHYYHRFVWYDNNLNLIKFTLPFYFFVNGIEYACGLEINYNSKSVIVGLGVEDKKAYLCEIDLNIIETYPKFYVSTGQIKS
jgi:vacuolar-type H+-ATPase subunit H/tetratricopeptide (TPR) repeat protein